MKESVPQGPPMPPSTRGSDLPVWRSRVSGPALLVLLMLLGAVPPLSTDMYLAALPSIGRDLGTSIGAANLTLVVFIVFLSPSMLFWGPLSDKYGRRPILLIGTAGYVVASLLCAFATDIAQLIVFRAVQALAGGASVAVSIAVTKDVYTSGKRARVLAITGTMIALAPILAPMIGAALLAAMSWRAIFIVLAGFGAITFAGCSIMKEPLRVRSNTSLLRTWGRLGAVLKNPNFTRLLVVFSVMAMPLLGFVGISSTIYMVEFGLDEQTFSLFFGLNAVVFALGPMVYVGLSRVLVSVRIIPLGLAATILAGALVLVLGNRGPISFAFAVLPASLGGTMLRPPSMSLMLDQHDGDAGSASSLIAALFGLFGGASLALMSLSMFTNKVLALGGVCLAAGVLSMVLWFLARKGIRIPDARSRSQGNRPT